MVGTTQVMCPECGLVECNSEGGFDEGSNCPNCGETGNGKLVPVLLLTVDDITELVATKSPREVVETLVHWAQH